MHPPANSPHWMTIADPIHGIIRFSRDNPVHRWVMTLMNTGPFQRLRRIKQMGLAEFVFPGATHSRFVHSLGAAHLMKQAIYHLQSMPDARDLLRDCYPGTRITFELLLMVGILLHDVGHPPLSHTLEDILDLIPNGMDHDGYWYRRILFEDPDLCRVWDRLDPAMPETLLKFMGELSSGQKSAAVCPPGQRVLPATTSGKHFLATLVSSQLDMDRLDYLQRDSHFMGVQYGRIEADRILYNLVLDHLAEDGAPVVAVREEAVPALEHYLFGRFQAYKMALHSLDKASESLLKQTLRRFYWARCQQIDTGSPAPALFDLIAACHQHSSDDMPVAAYLRMDDGYIWDNIQSWAAGSQDALLKSLAARLLRHDIFKFVEIRPSLSEAQQAQVKAGMAAYYDAHGLCFDFGFDEVAVKPKAMLQPSGAREPIWIRTSQGSVQDLRFVSTLPLTVAPERGYKLLWFVWDRGAREHLYQLLRDVA